MYVSSWLLRLVAATSQLAAARREAEPDSQRSVEGHREGVAGSNPGGAESKVEILYPFMREQTLP